VGLDLARDVREITCNLVLDPGRTIKGTVVDPDGKPIAGVELGGTWGYPSAPQDPLATAEFTLPAIDPRRPQPFFFTHRARKLGTMVMFKDDKVEGVTVKLQRLGVITGRLLDQDGVPAVKGSVMGQFESGQLGVKEGWGGFFWASIDKDGRFRAEVIPGVKVGAYFWPRPGSRRDRVFQNLTLQAGQVHDVGDVKVNTRPE
jgi:hypothetical protein